MEKVLIDYGLNLREARSGISVLAARRKLAEVVSKYGARSERAAAAQRELTAQRELAGVANYLHVRKL